MLYFRLLPILSLSAILAGCSGFAVTKSYEPDNWADKAEVVIALSNIRMASAGMVRLEERESCSSTKRVTPLPKVQVRRNLFCGGICGDPKETSVANAYLPAGTVVNIALTTTAPKYECLGPTKSYYIEPGQNYRLTIFNGGSSVQPLNCNFQLTTGWNEKVPEVLSTLPSC